MKSMKENNIGHAIKVLRTASRIKQKELAKKAGIKANYLSLVEAGRREPSLGVLRAIAKILNVPMSFLFWEAATQPKRGSQRTQDNLNRIKQLLLQLESLRIADQTNPPR